MKLKDSDELLAIWKKNDRLEWSGEVFAAIHEILLERFGSVPPQNIDSPRRRRNKKATDKSKNRLLLSVLFSPAILVLLLILLSEVINPEPDDQWFTVLFFLSMALFFFVPGFYFGWKSFFQSKATLKQIADRVALFKRAGIVYRLYTLFLPDRFVPVYLLILIGYASIIFIYGGIRMIMFLIELF